MMFYVPLSSTQIILRYFPLLAFYTFLAKQTSGNAYMFEKRSLSFSFVIKCW